MAAAAEANTAPQATTASANSSVLPLNRDVRVLLAEFVDNDTLLNLRLACKELSWEMDDLFIKRFFTYRRHLISRYSLGVLSEICSSHRLTRNLLKITLVSGGAQRRHFFPAQWEYEHREFMEGVHLSGFFWAILDSLSKACQRPAIVVSSRTNRKSFGESDMLSRSESYTLDPRSCQTIVRTLLGEVYRTGFQLTELSVYEDPAYGSLGLEGFYIPDGLSHMAQACWSQLSQLCLDFGKKSVLKDESLLGPIFPAAVNLTTLRISNVEGRWDELEAGEEHLSNLARMTADAPIREISLSCIEEPLQGFKGLVAPFAATLKAVQIEGCRIQEPDCWSTLLRYLLGSCGPSSLYLYELS